MNPEEQIIQLAAQVEELSRKLNIAIEIALVKAHGKALSDREREWWREALRDQIEGRYAREKRELAAVQQLQPFTGNVAQAHSLSATDRFLAETK